MKSGIRLQWKTEIKYHEEQGEQYCEKQEKITTENKTYHKKRSNMTKKENKMPQKKPEKESSKCDLFDADGL